MIHKPHAERVRTCIARRLGAHIDEVQPSASFIHDLKADSLDVVAVVMELEDEFEIAITDDEAEQLKTVGDAIVYVERRFATAEAA